MKKIIFLVALFLIPFCYTFSQSLQLLDDQDNIIPSGSTIQATCDTAGNVQCVKVVKVKNIGYTGPKTVKVIKTCMSGTAQHTNSFCWGSCYAFVACSQTPWTSLGNEPPIAEGAVNANFTGDCKSQRVCGSTLVKYVFYDITNISDSVSVLINYSFCTSGIEEEKIDITQIQFSNAFPNPANSFFSIKYAVPSSATNNNIVIKDMLGNVVKEIFLENNSGNIKIDITELPDGVYFYSLMIDSKIYATRKLVVN